MGRKVLSEKVDQRPHLLFGHADVQHDFARTLDVSVNAVTGHYGAHSFGRAREDQVTWLQVIKQRQVSDDFTDVPDQLVHV